MAGGFLLSCALFLLISITSFMGPLFIYFIYSAVMPSLQMLQCRYGFESDPFEKVRLDITSVQEYQTHIPGPTLWKMAVEARELY